MDKLSYALGMVISANLKGLGVNEMAMEDFCQAVKDVLAGSETALTETEAQITVSDFIRQREEERSKTFIAADEKYLAENAKKEGVTVTESGLQYLVLEPGLGRKPKATDTVRCHYEGRLIDGTVFDSSYRRGEPAEFPLNGVIRGWTEGLQLMGEGAKFRFFIPQHLGYGAQGAGQSIPPYSVLVFDVELIAVK